MNQGLRKEMQNYPNERIINNICQQDFFSPESVKIAKEIAIQRNLLTQNQIEKLNDERQWRNSSANAQRSSLAIGNNAASDNTGSSVIGVIFAVLIVFKIIIKLAIISN